jgi:hypothetical protein
MTKHAEVDIAGTTLPIEELHLTFLIDKLRKEFGFLESSKNNVPVSGDGEIMPLYTYPCYEYLRSITWTESNIFEFGCGYSSIWWGNQKANVHGVESEQSWVDRINPSGQFKISVEENVYNYTTSIYEHNILFDVIIIDGMYRYDCVEPSLECLADGGMIVVDNSDWHTNTKELLDQSALLPIHFHGFKPIHVDTETTSCYIHRDFNKKPRTILPMGGTKRPSDETDFPNA